MMSTEKSASSFLLHVLRWTARIGSLISIVLLLMFMFGGAEQPPSLNDPAMLGLIFFPITVMVGMLLGWWNDLIGGITTVIGLFGFYAWHLMESSSLPAGPYFVLFASPGILFLLVGCGKCMIPKLDSGG